jgi:hypothetical protein
MGRLPRTLPVAVPVKHRNISCYSLAARAALVNALARRRTNSAPDRAGKRLLDAA